MINPAGILRRKCIGSIINIVVSGTQHVNTFDVKAEYKVLSLGDDANAGVRFNAETVPAPLSQHKSKSVLSREMYLDYRSDQYNKKGAPFLEAASFHEGDMKLVAVRGNGFLTACLTAFAEHCSPW